MPCYRISGSQPQLARDGSVWIAPSADVIGDARLAEGVSVWFGAVIRADNTPIQIGSNSNIQEGAMLHSDPGYPLSIGGSVTVGHHAILHGCSIGDRVLVGMGARVLNGAVIAEDCLIGAGALVTEGKSFPAGSLIVGVPAQVKRPLSESELAMLRQSASDYSAKAMTFRDELELVSLP